MGEVPARAKEEQFAKLVSYAETYYRGQSQGCLDLLKKN